MRVRAISPAKTAPQNGGAPVSKPPLPPSKTVDAGGKKLISTTRSPFEVADRAERLRWPIVCVAIQGKTTREDRAARSPPRLHRAGERRQRMRALERAMEGAGVNWTDLGNWIEQGAIDEGKYTESELQEFGQAMRAEGVEAGIKIGRRARATASNGHSLPEAFGDGGILP